MTPVAVSLVSGSPCRAATSLLSIVNVGRRGSSSGKGFAVCVKGLSFPMRDLSPRLAEWLEVQRALGAKKVFLYSLAVHPNVRRLIRHYTRDGLVDHTQLALPGWQPNEPLLQHMYLAKKSTVKRQNEVVAYNDCLYRGLFDFGHVVLIDIDEVVATNFKDWHELLGALADFGEEFSSLCFRHVYFSDKETALPRWGNSTEEGAMDHLYVMRHIHHSSKYMKVVSGIPSCSLI